MEHIFCISIQIFKYLIDINAILIMIASFVYFDKHWYSLILAIYRALGDKDLFVIHSLTLVFVN